MHPGSANAINDERSISMRDNRLVSRGSWVSAELIGEIRLLLAVIAFMGTMLLPGTVSAQNSYPATRVPGAGQSPPGVIPAMRPGQGTGGGGIIPATRTPGQVPGPGNCDNGTPQNPRCFGGYDIRHDSYGSYANIDTIIPYTPLSGGVSFEFLETYSLVPDITFMQIGWTTGCQYNASYIFPEYYANGTYHME